MPNLKIDIHEVEKVYEGKRILMLPSIQIHQGENIAIIGPSGAGKTTLFNLLTNLIEPDKGTLMIDDKPYANYTNRRKIAQKIGLIRQQYDLIGPLPVIHNVLAGRLGEWGFLKSLLSLFLPQEKNLAFHALERVGLGEKMYERTSNLSGGEQQRVAIARLLVQKPEIILADEPVSSLDPARAEDIISMLVQLVKEGKQTLVASLHSVELAKKHFSRIIALKNGKIFFDLPVDKVVEEDLASLYHLMELKEDE